MPTQSICIGTYRWYSLKTSGVKAPEKKDENGNVISGGEISLDLTGRKSGRGAYVCKNADCFEKARKARRFERSLSCKIPEDVYEQMSKELENASED